MTEAISETRRGRPKGALNVATREFKLFWDRFFKSPEYRESAKRRILDGHATHLEAYLLAKVYGKPKEEIELRVGTLQDELEGLSTEELYERAAELTRQLEEARTLELELRQHGYDVFAVAPQSHPTKSEDETC